MNKFSTSLHLAPNVAEVEIDKIGKAVLIEQARAKGLSITSDAERIYDEFVVGVMATSVDGGTTLTHVPMSSPLAEGRTEPDARMVSWQADAKPFEQEPADAIVAEIHGEGKFSRAHLPTEVTESGGMIRLRHGLNSPDVEISAYDAVGNKIAYEFAAEIDANEQQILLLPGAVKIETVLDTDEETP